MNQRDEMARLMLLVENAEQLNEIDFKKAAATAGMIGALAGAPADTQASTDAAQGIDTNQPVATQQVQEPQAQAQAQQEPQGQKLVDNLYVGMSIEQVLESVPGAKTSRGSGNAIWYGANKKSIKVKAGGTQFEFDANDKLVGVHKMIGLRKSLFGPKAGAEYKGSISWKGYPNTEFRTIFTKVYKLSEPKVGNATGKVETFDGAKFGLGIGAITSKGIAMIGLDKTGTSSATVPTINGSFTMISLTQSGMANRFTPMNVVLSYHAPRPQSELEF